MSANTTTGVSLSVTTADSTDEKINALIEIVEDQERRISELEKENDELQEQLSKNAKDHAETKSRVTDLENTEKTDTNDETPTPDAGETTIQNTPQTPQTPLERTVALPEGMADSELTANQKRARFVAKDIHEYSRSVPAGRAIKSSEISTVLRAGTDCKGRSQTVSRVIDFLRELGGDGVKIVERRGERRVVFSDHAAKRLSKLGGRDRDQDHGGVTTAKA